MGVGAGVGVGVDGELELVPLVDASVEPPPLPQPEMARQAPSASSISARSFRAGTRRAFKAPPLKNFAFKLERFAARSPVPTECFIDRLA